MKLAEALLCSLRDHGAKEIFGIPGDFALPLFKVIEQTKILPLYTLSHEPAIAFAADAAARFDRRLGVAAVTFGAGALNLVNGVAAAYAEKVPLVVVSGAPGLGEQGRGLLLHHQAKSIESQEKIFREITCAQARLNDPASAPKLIADVLRRCLDESRPVYIELPRDLVMAECSEVEPLVRAQAQLGPLKSCVSEIQQKLENAKRPVVMVGVEIRRFGLEEETVELLKKLNLPVVTSFMGRGLLARAEVPVVGTYVGEAGDPEAAKVVDESDLLFLLGVIPCDNNLGISERTMSRTNTILAVDNQVSLDYHSYSDVPLYHLIPSLLESAVPHSQRLPELSSPRSTLPLMPRDEQSVKPLDIAAAVQELWERSGPFVIASDIGDCLFTAFEISNVELIAPGYYATMGYGIPAGIGLQIASGRRPLILVGDGAFQMTGWELGNCAKYGLNPIVILFNNSSWEMLRAFEPDVDFNDLVEWKFAELAKSLGGKGYRVQTRGELGLALDQAAADTTSFQLIEVMLPRGLRSPILESFARKVEKMRS